MRAGGNIEGAFARRRLRGDRQQQRLQTSDRNA